MKDLKSELSGDFRELTLALYMYAPAYDAKCLRRAMKGLGTKESVSNIGLNVFITLHSHGRLLAAKIGIWPFFFLNGSCFFLDFKKKKKTKCRFSQPKAARVNSALRLRYAFFLPYYLRVTQAYFVTHLRSARYVVH